MGVTRGWTERHGMHGTRIYKVWVGMLARCNNKNAPQYKNYGGRGIQVCLRWRVRFSNFFVDMGDVPAGKSLDRVDNDGNYESKNCRWATAREQVNNRRNTLMLTHDGRTQPLTVWADETGIKHKTIRERLARGWPVADALSTPVGGRA